MSASSLVASGTNKISPAFLPLRTGSATLVAGTVTISLPFASATDTFLLTRTSAPLANGLAVTAVDSTGPIYGFTITSSSNTDTGVVSWVQYSGAVPY